MVTTVHAVRCRHTCGKIYPSITGLDGSFHCPDPRCGVGFKIESKDILGVMEGQFAPCPCCNGILLIQAGSDPVKVTKEMILSSRPQILAG